MKAGSLRSALQTAVLAVALPFAAYADGDGTSTGGLQAKAGYCTDCHGTDGQGYIGWYPMPRIAGQRREYFANQLKSFVSRNRENDIAILMYKVHNVSPALGSALAAHFKRLDPRPFGGAPEGLAERGRRIYEEGIPEDNVPACSACHGPNAHGDGQNPRLAGQLYTYVVKELSNWAHERAQESPSETVAVMTPIAAALSKDQIKAVAAYLSAQR
ncbi:MAG: c-type cytochrome [Rhodomicrobium sp.]